MRRTAMCFTLAVVLLSASLAAARDRGTPVGKVYTLDEVSVFDCPAWVRTRMLMGQLADECGRTPSAEVTYPAFASKEPIYGAIVFGKTLFDPRAGVRCHFALDQSAGTGYDRLYFDTNRDSDLTNDSPVGLTKDTPAGLQDVPGDICFENVQVTFDRGPGQGTFAQTVMPRLMRSRELTYMFFAVPTARRGRIALGPRKVELVLGQTYMIAGRYDHPITGAFVVSAEETLAFLGRRRSVDGTFYCLSATPSGDKVTVTPYTGPFGTLRTRAPGGGTAALTIESGWVHSRDALIDIDDCPWEDDRLSLPVGDYRPVSLTVRHGRRRIGLAVDTSQLGRADAPAEFPIKIREHRPFVLDVSGRLEVVFQAPDADERIRTGQTVKVAALLCDPAEGMKISTIQDTTRRIGAVVLPSGGGMDMFESVSPTVRITNASGRTVAEGTMPFG